MKNKGRYFIMEKKIVIENAKNETKAISETPKAFDDFAEKFDALLDDLFSLPDGFSKASMQRIEYELSQVENGCDIISVFEQEGVKLDDGVLSFFKKFVSNDIPSNDELNEFFSKVSEGNTDAKQCIVDAHQWLVALIAKEYYIQNVEIDSLFDIRRFNMSFDELVKIGNIGLEKAINKFDFENGYNFSSYALWWICTSFSRTVADLFHIPVYTMDTINTVYQYVQQMSKELERTPTAQELAEKLDIKIEKIEKLLKIIQKISEQGKDV